MADLDKSIKLNVESNANKTTQDFDKLNKKIDDTVKNFNKLMKLFSATPVVTGLKSIEKEMDKLAKTFVNFNAVTQVFDELQKKVTSMTNALSKANNAANGEDEVRHSAKVLQDKSKKNQAYIAFQRSLLQNEKQLEKDYERESSLAKLGRMKVYGKSLSQAAGSKSILGFAGAGLQALTSEVFGTVTDKVHEAFNKKYLSKQKELFAQEAIIRDPNSSVAEREAARTRKAALQKQISFRKKEEEKYDKKMAGRAALVSAVINLVVGTLKKFGDTIKTTTGVTVSLKENFQNLMNSIGSVLNMQTGAASFASGSTLYTNPKARTQQMKYGLSNAQNYALYQTMGMLGMQTDEDLMYMNKEQQKLFSAMMQKYSSWYEKMESSGVLQNVQEMQMDIKMFKEELVMDFMNWFSENKDDIVNSIKLIAKFVMTIASGMAKATGWVSKGLSWMFGQDSSAISSTMSSAAYYSDSTVSRNSGRVNNININMNNTATGVLSSQEAMEGFFQEQIDTLAKNIEQNTL